MPVFGIGVPTCPSGIASKVGALITPDISNPVNKLLAISTGDSFSPVAALAAVVANPTAGLSMPITDRTGLFRNLETPLGSGGSSTHTIEYSPTLEVPPLISMKEPRFIKSLYCSRSSSVKPCCKSVLPSKGGCFI